MNVICFGHRKQQGKDTAARLLETQLNMRYPKMKVKRAALAGKVYEVCQLLNPEFLSKAHYDANPLLKKELMSCGRTPREMLIAVGENLKQYDPLIWVKQIYDIDCDFLIITDLRFKDEAYHLPGLKVKIERGRVPTDGPDEDLKNYAWDHVILNKGTIRELGDKVIDFVLTNYDLREFR